ncbi:hypothetical protein BVI1335_400094 [Burkholderia vietnamiensis]|nr:hypothetical protein BVI1335_400094 [Burkholderia vietnamiensis]
MRFRPTVVAAFLVAMRMRIIFVFDGMLVPTRAMGMMSV